MANQLNPQQKVVQEWTQQCEKAKENAQRLKNGASTCSHCKKWAARARKPVVGEEMASESKEVDGGRKEGRKHNFWGVKDPLMHLCRL